MAAYTTHELNFTFPRKMSPVVPGQLYLCGKAALDQLPFKGKTGQEIHVLSVISDEVKLNHTQTEDHMWIKADDSADINLLPLFPDACMFIVKGLENPGDVVVVHCECGISRSTTLVVAYLMFINHWTRTRALQEVRKTREWVNPNPGFMKQLAAWEQQLAKSK
jgi:protein-tyrosine phosphatase